MRDNSLVVDNMNLNPFCGKLANSMLCLFLSFSGLSQKLIGTVYDAKTKKGIPFCSILNVSTKNGVIANEFGQFVLNDSSLADSLTIGSVGYQTLTVSRRGYESMSLYLNEQVNQLKEVAVYSRMLKKYEVGASGKYSNGSFEGPVKSTLELALLILNPTNEEGIIDKVSLYIVKGGALKTPFKLRLYENNSGLVGKSVLTQDIVFTGYKRNGWNSFDVSQYGLKFPPNGCYLSFEWTHVDDSNYEYEIDTHEGKKGYGQIIGFTNEFSVPMSYKRSNGDDWVSSETFFTVMPRGFFQLPVYYNPMFKLTVLY